MPGGPEHGHYDEQGRWVDPPRREWEVVLAALAIVLVPAGWTVALIYWLAL